VDTELKHRLTGAVILVALVVLLVPEMLSGPRAPSSAPAGPTPDPPTSGMAPAAPVRSVDIDLGESLPTAPSPAPASAPAPPRIAPATAPGRPAVASAPGSPTPRLPLEGHFVVQAGSFAAPDSAEALAARLRRDGFDVQISTVQSAGRTWHRVRVGSATDRVAAEALLMRLRAAGHSGVVVVVQ
jgi:DedD protein